MSFGFTPNFSLDVTLDGFVPAHFQRNTNRISLLSGFKKPDNQSLFFPAIGLAAILVLATSILAFDKIPNPGALYQKKMHAFTGFESRALAVYNHNQDIPTEAWVRSIRDSGIYYWNQSIRVLDEANELELSDPIKRRTDVLIEYCNLRIASYNYIANKFSA